MFLVLKKNSKCRSIVLENTLEMQQVTVEYFLQCKVLNFHFTRCNCIRAKVLLFQYKFRGFELNFINYMFCMAKAFFFCPTHFQQLHLLIDFKTMWTVPFEIDLKAQPLPWPSICFATIFWWVYGRTVWAVIPVLEVSCFTWTCEQLCWRWKH